MSEAPRHPDFEPGNLVAVKTGAHSPRIRAAKAEELEPGFNDWLTEVAPWAAEDAFELQRVNYLWSKAIVELLSGTVVEALAGRTKMSTRDVEAFLSSLRNEREALAAMGLTVQTKTEMAQTVASTEKTLGDLAAEGRAIRAGRTDLGTSTIDQEPTE